MERDQPLGDGAGEHPASRDADGVRGEPVVPAGADEVELMSGGGPRAAGLTRRAFLATAAGVAGVGIAGAAALVGLRRKGGRPLAGGFADDGHAAGHALRDRAAAPAIRRTVRVPVVIVGGGAAGLSAAWWLERNGMRDYVLLELAGATGGNARSGENAVSAYPWGAHYVPVPGPRAVHVRTLFEEMGVLRDGVWQERDLCQAPKERVFVHGRWRDGLEEAIAPGPEDHDALRRFGDEIAALRERGEFTIPMALGVRADSPLDRVTAAEWLETRGHDAPALRWLVDYACRDDFGTRARDTSAWAALHYFAARDADEEGPLTWPEGNGRIVRHLATLVAPRVVTGAPVRRIERRGRLTRVLAGDTAYECEAAIFAAPAFVAPHVIEGASAPPWRYAPWMVANLTLDRIPRDGGRDSSGSPHSAGAAWDNVIADSAALGYVVATHQSLRTVEERSVWTWYWALADGDPSAERRRLLAADWRTCAEWALADLERAHPDLRDCVARVDVMRYGHAMPRPEPGFLAARRALWGDSSGRLDATAPGTGAPRVFHAHSDVSGLSLFEEAQHRGIEAAERAMALLGRGG